MRNRIAVAVAAIVVLLGACAAPPPSPEETALANEPLYCAGPEQCSLYWRRAQVWLANNSPYRIQSATDTVITTHGPMSGSVSRAYQVVRMPLDGGREEITITSGCGNIYGCDTHADASAASFKRFVKTGGR